MKILNNKRVLFLLKLAISAAILIFVGATRVSFTHLVHVFLSANIGWFLLSLVLGFIQRYVCAWQTRIDLVPFGIDQSIAYIFKSQLVASLYSLVFPGDLIGGGVTWHYLSRDNGMRAQVAAVLVFLRLANFLVIVLLAALGVMLEPRLQQLHLGPALSLFFFLVAIMMLPFFVPLLSRRLESISSALIEWVPLPKGRQRLAEAAANVWISVRSYQKLPGRHIAAVFGLSVAMHFVAAMAILGCLWSAGIPVGVATALWVFSLLVVVQSLPISFAGIGVRDLSMVFVLGWVFGVSAENAVLFSSLILLTALIFGGLMGGWVQMTLRSRVK